MRKGKVRRSWEGGVKIGVDSQVFDIDAVQLHCQAHSWQEAIRIAALPLLERGYIKQKYIELMIKSIEELGPYIVLMPGLALAHAEPGPYVLKSDLSVAVFDEPIEFVTDENPVHVVICLACVDRESHLNRLQAIAEKFMEEPATLEKIKACTSREELVSLFR